MIPNGLDKLLSSVQPRVEAVAMEALTEIFHRFPWGQEMTFANGTKGAIKKFVEPRLNAETGRPEFGFDVKGADWHLEFFVRQEGWGGAP